MGGCTLEVGRVFLMGNHGAGDLNDIQRMQGVLRSKLLSQELSDGKGRHGKKNLPT